MENKPVCPDKPCRSTRRRDVQGSKDVNACLQSRPVLYAGVIWIGAMRRFFVPRYCGTTLPPSETVVPTPVRQEFASLTPTEAGPLKILQQPTTTLHASNTIPEDKPDVVQHRSSSEESEPSAPDKSPGVTLLSQIKDTYETIAGDARRFSEDVKAMKQHILEATSEAFKNMRGADEASYRYIAVSSSGLGSYLLGLRYNIRTRVVYTATGAIAMATLCYPEQARHYNLEAVTFIRNCVERGIDLVMIDLLNLPKDETPDGKTFSFVNYEKRNDNFSKNMKHGIDNDNEVISEDSNINFKQETDSKNADIKPDVLNDDAAYLAGQCSNLPDQCGAIPCNQGYQQLSQKCDTNNTLIGKSVPINSTCVILPTSTVPNIKKYDTDPIHRNRNQSSLENNECNEHKSEELTNHLSKLQDDQIFPGVAETTNANVDFTKQKLLKDHDLLNRKEPTEPNKNFACSFEKQSKYTIDSSIDDHENLYTRRT